MVGIFGSFGNSVSTSAVGLQTSPAAMAETTKLIAPLVASRAIVPIQRTLPAYLPVRSIRGTSLFVLPIQKKTVITAVIPMNRPDVKNILNALAAQTGSMGPGGLAALGFEQHDGLWIVSPEALPLVQALLGTMTYTGTDDGGIATLSTGGGNTWSVVQQKLSSGYAAIINKTGGGQVASAELVFTKDPHKIAKLVGGDSAQYALLSDQPADVISDAAKVQRGEFVAPKWLWPVAIGAGALVLVAILMSRKKATPNRRRQRFQRSSSAELHQMVSERHPSSRAARRELRRRRGHRR